VELKGVLAFMIVAAKDVFEDASATLKTNLLAAADRK
jgi:hypothetical protein